MGSCAAKKTEKKKQPDQGVVLNRRSESAEVRVEKKVITLTSISKSVQGETNNESFISKPSSVRTTEKRLTLEKIKSGLFKVYTILNKEKSQFNFSDGQVIFVQHNISGVKKRIETVTKNGNRSKNLVQKILIRPLVNEYICSITDIYQDLNCYYLVQDYCSGGCLSELKENLKEEQVVILLLQLISAIQYLHSIKLFHGQLTINSFYLLNNQKNLFCKLVDISPLFSKNGLLQIEPTKLDQNSDIFQIGSIAYELLFGVKPFSQKLQMQQGDEENQDTKSLLEYKFPISPFLKKAFSKMLEQESREVVNLTFIKQLLNNIMNKKVQKDILVQPLYFLSQCKQRNYFHFIILDFMLNKFSPEEQIILQKIFKDADQDEDGFITQTDLTRLFKSVIEYENIEIDVSELLQRIDSNNSGKIDQYEFITAACDVQSLLQIANLETTFKYLSNQSGTLTVSTLRKHCLFDESMLLSVLEELRGHSKLKLSEFIEVMRQLV